ncbi:unnamed protein product [Cercopithifilaria johnstoni]|uniref:Uncharacterized protein n=1 Tax=Cercopithifilaria johnstoni TaxID=2874296 RepID=A0A8J2LMI3_9BILA|nr:unnamed protein product [Cercopithifilaria johnstoni]
MELLVLLKWVEVVVAVVVVGEGGHVWRDRMGWNGMRWRIDVWGLEDQCDKACVEDRSMIAILLKNLDDSIPRLPG